MTVLMAVYNGEEYIMETVESVLGQSYEDFEFLVIDDGSEDGSYGLVRWGWGWAFEVNSEEGEFGFRVLFK